MAMRLSPAFLLDFLFTSRRYVVQPTSCESVDPLDDTCDARWITLISDAMRHVLIRRIKETRSNKEKVKGPEPGEMRHHVGCVHKHVNHGTEEKTNKDHACKLKAMD